MDDAEQDDAEPKAGKDLRKKIVYRVPHPLWQEMLQAAGKQGVSVTKYIHGSVVMRMRGELGEDDPEGEA